MARRSRVSVDDILQHLNNDSFDCAGSDDDLGMDSDYDYESDSSQEGIIFQIKMNVNTKFYIVLKKETMLMPLIPIRHLQQELTSLLTSPSCEQQNKILHKDI